MWGSFEDRAWIVAWGCWRRDGAGQCRSVQLHPFGFRAAPQPTPWQSRPSLAASISTGLISRLVLLFGYVRLGKACQCSEGLQMPCCENSEIFSTGLCGPFGPKYSGLTIPCFPYIKSMKGLPHVSLSYVCQLAEATWKCHGERQNSSQQPWVATVVCWQSQGL